MVGLIGLVLIYFGFWFGDFVILSVRGFYFGVFIIMCLIFKEGEKKRIWSWGIGII